MSQSFLGRGFSFPFRLNSAETGPSFSEDEQLVRESIDSILSTSKYDRPFRVKRGVLYGVGVHDYLFENSVGAIDVIRYDTKRALEVWEPRIVVLDVTANAHTDFVSKMTGIIVMVSYRFRATNRSDNFVNFYQSKNPGS